MNRARTKYLASNQTDLTVVEQIHAFHRYVEIQLKGVSDDRIYKHLPMFFKTQYHGIMCDALSSSGVSIMPSHVQLSSEV
jgi:hypothetical protein